MFLRRLMLGAAEEQEKTTITAGGDAPVNGQEKAR